jgi:hypothetical protein
MTSAHPGEARGAMRISKLEIPATRVTSQSGRTVQQRPQGRGAVSAMRLRRAGATSHDGAAPARRHHPVEYIGLVRTVDAVSCLQQA